MIVIVIIVILKHMTVTIIVVITITSNGSRNNPGGIPWCPQCLKRGKKPAPAAKSFHDFLPTDKGKGSLIKRAT